MGDHRDERIGVDLTEVRSIVEREGVGRILRRIDYELYDAQEPVDAEVAEETFGWLAVPADIDGDRDLSGVILYVDESLRYLADAVPDSYFTRLYDGTSHDGYRIATSDDEYVELYFDRRHGGDRIEVPTRYDYLTIYVPTVEAYIEYSKARGLPSDANE